MMTFVKQAYWQGVS